jgi:hypothetical protein
MRSLRRSSPGMYWTRRVFHLLGQPSRCGGQSESHADKLRRAVRLPGSRRGRVRTERFRPWVRTSSANHTAHRWSAIDCFVDAHGRDPRANRRHGGEDRRGRCATQSNRTRAGHENADALTTITPEVLRAIPSRRSSLPGLVPRPQQCRCWPLNP